MAFVRSERLWETSTTTGTGNMTLAGAVSGYRAFSDEMVNTDTVYYTIVNQGATTEWESGIGTWNTGGTLSRTTVLESSNSDALVNFSAGTKDVFCELPARALNMKYPTVDAAENMIVPGGHDRDFPIDLTVNGSLTVVGRLRVG